MTVWLPVPPARKTQVGNLPSDRSLRLPGRAAVEKSWGERTFLALLTLASLAGITYGFSCLVDLVQNWALFGAGIDRLIQ